MHQIWNTHRGLNEPMHSGGSRLGRTQRIFEYVFAASTSGACKTNHAHIMTTEYAQLFVTIGARPHSRPPGGPFSKPANRWMPLSISWTHSAVVAHLCVLPPSIPPFGKGRPPFRGGRAALHTTPQHNLTHRHTTRRNTSNILHFHTTPHSTA